MKVQKCYSSLARRRMHHVIYRHCIQFSQIHVTQSLSVKSGYSSPKHWILNRTFGHLAAQNSHLRQYHENELPNHGVHARRGTSPSSWVPITDTFSMMTGQYSHGAELSCPDMEVAQERAPPCRVSRKENLQKLQSVLLQKESCHLAAQQTELVAGGCVTFPALHCCPQVPLQPRVQLCCLHDVTGTDRGVKSEFFIISRI